MLQILHDRWTRAIAHRVTQWTSQSSLASQLISPASSWEQKSVAFLNDCTQDKTVRHSLQQAVWVHIRLLLSFALSWIRFLAVFYCHKTAKPSACLHRWTKCACILVYYMPRAISFKSGCKLTQSKRKRYKSVTSFTHCQMCFLFGKRGRFRAFVLHAISTTLKECKKAHPQNQSHNQLLKGE